MKPTILAALLAALSLPANAQQLLAWPIDTVQPALRAFLPGMPLPRPVPPPNVPRPQPFPLPGPAPVPAPQPQLPPDAAPVTMAAYHVEGTVTDQVADLTYRIVFRNPTDRRLEGVLMVPLPADATLSGFSMIIGGKDTKGELLEADRAAQIYQSIVSRAIDPGLLELVGERMYRARVFPIEPRGEVVATLKMTQTLPKSGGLVTLNVPMRSARFVQGQGGKASAKIALKTTRPLRAIVSPNPGVTVTRSGERAAEVSYQEGDEARDLVLNFSLREDPLAAGVLAHRTPGEDGTFLLTLSPRLDAAKAAPKAVVFVFDRSGSMAEGGKMEQAKKALAWCVSRLDAGDRFGIVDFATDWNALEESRLLPATEENKARARRYIERLDPAGGTNIEAGLEQGLKLLAGAGEAVPMLFFLTDGVPTQGQTDPAALLRRAADANKTLKARVFSFGVGSDVNTLLLDKLADAGRGARDYAAPNEDIEAKLSSLYQKVARPALTDVRLAWNGVEVEQAYPRPVPDLFHGGELALYGRYRAGGKGTLVVTGKAGGRAARFEFPVELPENEDKNDFLPRLWATQKIGHELDAIRLSGRPADPEVVSSIVKLAKKHGIVTPYTSYLVTEEGTDLRQAEQAARRRFDALSVAAVRSGFSGGMVAGASAQADSKRMARMTNMAAVYASVRGSASGMGAPASPTMALDAMESEAREELKGKNERAVATRAIGGKTFYRRGEAWVDGEAELGAKLPEKTVTARGADYFALLAAEPGLAKFLSLGDRVSVVWKGTLYKIVTE